MANLVLQQRGKGALMSEERREVEFDTLALRHEEHKQRVFLATGGWRVRVRRVKSKCSALFGQAGGQTMAAGTLDRCCMILYILAGMAAQRAWAKGGATE